MSAFLEADMGSCVYECRQGAATAPLDGGYRRREPEKTVLYSLVAQELATFRARVHELADGAGLPGFVLEEFERYLGCGLLSRGFARVRCPSCREEILVAFSCKSRGLCPSCGARRMHDTAAHLVDRILPRVPYRQWVMAWPKWLRPLLARDPSLASEARAIFLGSVFVWQRRRARALGLRHVGTGAVSFQQRAGDSLNLNPHVHAVLPDGVFLYTDDAELLFQPLPRPRDEDVLSIAKRIVLRTLRLLERRGLWHQEQLPDALDLLAAAAVPRGRAPPTDEPRRLSPLSAVVDGFSLNAGTHVHQNDRAGLEHLCAYGSRPPLALTRLSRLEDGRYSYALKYPLPDGSLRLVLSGQALMGRLALLVPRPRIHLARYHGVFASHSSWRPYVVPEQSLERSVPSPLPANSSDADPALPKAPTALSHDAFIPERAPNPGARYLDWAALLKRVYSEDLLLCPNCGDTRRIIAFIEDPLVAHRILDHLGLPSTGPPRAPARPPPQAEIFV